MNFKSKNALNKCKNSFLDINNDLGSYLIFNTNLAPCTFCLLLRLKRVVKDDNGVYAEAIAGSPAGPYTQTDGYLSYHEICERVCTP